jgi:hypothetical protein
MCIIARKLKRARSRLARSTGLGVDEHRPDVRGSNRLATAQAGGNEGGKTYTESNEGTRE